MSGELCTSRSSNAQPVTGMSRSTTSTTTTRRSRRRGFTLCGRPREIFSCHSRRATARDELARAAAAERPRVSTRSPKPELPGRVVDEGTPTGGRHDDRGTQISVCTARTLPRRRPHRETCAGSTGREAIPLPLRRRPHRPVNWGPVSSVAWSPIRSGTCLRTRSAIRDERARGPAGVSVRHPHACWRTSSRRRTVSTSRAARSCRRATVVAAVCQSYRRPSGIPPR